jgi:endonuclease YncB( thermonuclease family)
MVCNRILVMALCAAASHAAFAELNGKVVGVSDGDTLTLRVDGASVRVRLDGIDAPELGQPYGKSARRSLVQICSGKAATAVERGKDDEGRILASVRCGEIDANAEQVRRGMAWVRLRYVPFGSPLYEAETNARLQKVGLWRGKEPMPPWEWRARQTKKDEGKS